MSPFQTSVSVRQENIANRSSDNIDLQILNPDETWTENTTVMTGNPSMLSNSNDHVDQWWKEDFPNFPAKKIIVKVITLTVMFISICSPLMMIIWPRFGYHYESFTVLTVQQKRIYSSCNLECKGHVISLIFKSFLLAIGNWIIFLKHGETNVPQLCMYRVGTIILTTLCCCCFWLFYIVQITDGIKTVITGDFAEYNIIVNFAANFIDILLFIHYISVIFIEIYHLRPNYYIKVVRSPDGASQSYALGQLSIQRAAVCILQRYYTEFPIYNPHLERFSLSKNLKKDFVRSFKFYNVDESNKITSVQNKSSNNDGSINAQLRRRDTFQNDKSFDETEYERRVRKRKARLISAVEEAFANIERINSTAVLTNLSPLSPMEAAQSIFPSMARALQKYLRVTRQQPHHSIENIIQRLAKCLSQDVTPRAFLEPFFVQSPVLSNELERRSYQHWTLFCEGDPPSRQLKNGCEFQLRQGSITLLCSVYQLPNLYLSEKMAIPMTNRFLLKFNTEI